MDGIAVMQCTAQSGLYICDECASGGRGDRATLDQVPGEVLAELRLALGNDLDLALASADERILNKWYAESAEKRPSATHNMVLLGSVDSVATYCAGTFVRFQPGTQIGSNEYRQTFGHTQTSEERRGSGVERSDRFQSPCLPHNVPQLVLAVPDQISHWIVGPQVTQIFGFNESFWSTIN